MKATSRRTNPKALANEIEIREHRLLADEPPDLGGRDTASTPQELLAASLASCTAITIEMYAERKGWDLGALEVQVEYETPERGQPTKFELVLRLPDDCNEEQRERLQVIAGKCPVHRILAGEVTFEERVETTAPR